MSEINELIEKRHLASAVGTLTYILFGPILWALQLSIVYGGHTLICTGAMADESGQWLVLAVSIIIALVLMGFLFVPRAAARMLGLSDNTPGRRAYDRLSRLLGYLALVAIVWTGTTALVVSSCIQAR